MYTNTKVKGDQAQIETICFLKRNGYSVSIPFGENDPYDLIAESPSGNLYRVQVRWASWKNEVLKVSLRAISKNYVRTLDLSRIDAFVAYDGNDFYIVPKALFDGRAATVQFRKVAARNNTLAS